MLIKVTLFLWLTGVPKKKGSSGETVLAQRSGLLDLQFAGVVSGRDPQTNKVACDRRSCAWRSSAQASIQGHRQAADREPGGLTEGR